MFKIDKNGRNDRQLSTLGSCALHRLYYTTHCLLPRILESLATSYWSQQFSCFFRLAVRTDKFFKNLSTRFYCLAVTFNKVSSFKFILVNLPWPFLKKLSPLKSFSHLPYLLQWKFFKNYDYFILKTLFMLKILEYLSWRFGLFGLIRKTRLISKFMTSQPG